MRSAITILGMLVLYFIGLIGESLMNVFHMQVHALGISLPLATRLAVDSFPINRGYFVASMTPVMLLILLAGVGTKKEDGFRFLQRLILIGLVGLAYFALYAWCLILPFHQMGVGIGDCITGKAVVVIDCLIVVGSIFL